MKNNTLPTVREGGKNNYIKYPQILEANTTLFKNAEA